jgi:hypothetical protein
LSRILPINNINERNVFDYRIFRQGGGCCCDGTAETNRGRQACSGGIA